MFSCKVIRGISRENNTHGKNWNCTSFKTSEAHLLGSSPSCTPLEGTRKAKPYQGNLVRDSGQAAAVSWSLSGRTSSKRKSRQVPFLQIWYPQIQLFTNRGPQCPKSIWSQDADSLNALKTTLQANKKKDVKCLPIAIILYNSMKDLNIVNGHGVWEWHGDRVSHIQSLHNLMGSWNGFLHRCGE